MPSTSKASVSSARSWHIRGGTISLDRPRVMGVVNVTPDSFSDGGRYFAREEAIAHGRRLVAEGADLLDVGGESTRPGSEAVSVDEELRRVVPVVEALVGAGVPISVDTRKAAVAESALRAGAKIVNDVSSLSDPTMAHVVRRHEAGLVLMHMRGEPKTMQAAPDYKDVVAEVREWLSKKAEAAIAGGIPHGSIVLDPGIGFGKRTGKGIEDNATLLKHVSEFRSLGYPLLIGASRKTFIGNLLNAPVEERLEGSLAAAAVATWLGAEIVRVHDVKATRRVVDLVDAVRRAP